MPSNQVLFKKSILLSGVENRIKVVSNAISFGRFPVLMSAPLGNFGNSKIDSELKFDSEAKRRNANAVEIQTVLLSDVVSELVRRGIASLA